MFLSFGTIAEMAVKSLAAIFSVTVYVFLVTSVLPAVFLKPRYRYSSEGDRGMKRYAFEGGRAIVYEPSAPYRGYLKRYILSAEGEEKYIRCKFDESVRYVIYDVIAFNSADRVIDTVRVKEDIGGEQGGISKSAMLPSDTAYVKVAVRGVNETPVREEKLFEVPLLAVLGFFACTTLGLVGEMLFLRWILVSFAEVLFAYSSFTTGYGGIFAAVSAAAVGLILSGLLRYLYHMPEQIKKMKKMARVKPDDKAKKRKTKAIPPLETSSNKKN